MWRRCRRLWGNRTRYCGILTSNTRQGCQRCHGFTTDDICCISFMVSCSLSIVSIISLLQYHKANGGWRLFSWWCFHPLAASPLLLRMSTVCPLERSISPRFIISRRGSNMTLRYKNRILLLHRLSCISDDSDRYIAEGFCQPGYRLPVPPSHPHRPNCSFSHLP